MEEKLTQRIFAMVDGGEFKIDTKIPDDFDEEKVINTLLKMKKKGLFDKFEVFQKMIEANCGPFKFENPKFDELNQPNPSKDEISISVLTEAGFDIDEDEHVLAVFKKTIDHLVSLDRNNFKKKFKDIKKKSRRVIHKLEKGIEGQEGLNELIEEAKSYFDNFDQYWSKRRRRSSMSVTADESLTEGVL